MSVEIRGLINSAENRQLVGKYCYNCLIICDHIIYNIKGATSRNNTESITRAEVTIVLNSIIPRRIDHHLRINPACYHFRTDRQNFIPGVYFTRINDDLYDYEVPDLNLIQDTTVIKEIYLYRLVDVSMDFTLFENLELVSIRNDKNIEEILFPPSIKHINIRNNNCYCVKYMEVVGYLPRHHKITIERPDVYGQGFGYGAITYDDYLNKFAPKSQVKSAQKV